MASVINTRLFTFLLIGMLCIVMLGGCKNKAQRQAKKLQNDQHMCASFGFKAGSKEFAECMMQQQSYRQQNQILECQRVKMEEANKTSTYSSRGGAFFGGMSKALRINRACDF